MAWVRRGRKLYYYRTRRVGGRVLREYLGSGPEAELAAALDSARRAMASQVARGYTAPVGLLGLMTTMARVRGETSFAISSGSGTKSFSGRHG